MDVFLWNARARNTDVEATLNHPFPAQASGVHVAHAVAHHPTVALVALGGNALGDDTARAFADALRESPSLLTLNLAAAKFHYDHFRDARGRRFDFP